MASAAALRMQLSFVVAPGITTLVVALGIAARVVIVAPGVGNCAVPGISSSLVWGCSPRPSRAETTAAFVVVLATAGVSVAVR